MFNLFCKSKLKMSSCELEKGRMVANIDSDIKLDKYRWVIISIYGIYCGVNFSQFLQFTIIANLTERYYDVGNLTTDSTSLVFMVAFIILFVPIGRFIEKNTLRTTAVVSTGMTVIGTLIKLFAVQKDRFYLNIISQSICGIAQVFMLSIPSKVANTWFGAGEVSTACAVGVTLTQIGLALGALLPTLMVPNVKDDAELEAGFTSLFILDNIASIAVFIVVLFFFRSGPDSPPSQSQACKMNNNKEKEIEYVGSFGKLLQETDFLLVLVCFGASYGNWNSMGILINEIYLNFFPENGKYLGILVLVGILSGGVFGTLIFGYILDETHQYKKVSFYVLALNCIFWICLSISLQLQSEIGTFIFIPAYGFTSGSLMVITYEFAIETSYPNPEELSTGLMNAVIYLFAICNVLILEVVFKFAGILAGQILMAIDYSACALLILFISSNLKRRKANLLELPLKNYGSSDE